MANSKRISNYTGSATEINIPTSINGILVREIADNAFTDKGLTKITLDAYTNEIPGAPWGATNAQIIWSKEPGPGPGPTPTTRTITWDGDPTGKEHIISGDFTFVRMTTSLPGDNAELLGKTIKFQVSGAYEPGLHTNIINGCELNILEELAPTITSINLEISSKLNCDAVLLVSEDTTIGGMAFHTGIYFIKSTNSDSPFYVTYLSYDSEVPTMSITWDGNITGKTPYTIEDWGTTYYHVSDTIPTYRQLAAGSYSGTSLQIYSNDPDIGSITDFVEETEFIEGLGYFGIISIGISGERDDWAAYILFVKQACTIRGTTFTTPGTYFQYATYGESGIDYISNLSWNVNRNGIRQTVVWDGDITGKEVAYDNYYKISSAIPSSAGIVGCRLENSTGKVQPYPAYILPYVDHGDYVNLFEYGMIIRTIDPEDPVSTGIWFIKEDADNYTTSFTYYTTPDSN